MARTMQIRLGAKQVVRSDSSIGGYKPGLTAAEYWERGRYEWVFNADRALACDEVELISSGEDGEVVLAVATVEAVFKIGGRYGIEGKLVEDDPRIGLVTTHPHPSRNPIAYF